MMAQQITETESTKNRPAITFETITFSGGRKLDLEENDVVVFVGPNNTGKSVALKELQQHLAGNTNTKVIKSSELRTTGTTEDFLKFLGQHTEVHSQGSRYRIEGPGISFRTNRLEDLWPANPHQLHALFCTGIETAGRINNSDSVEAIHTTNEQPRHPIHRLYMDDKLELKISDYFEQAFGQALILDRQAGGIFPLMVGERLTPNSDENLLSATYWKRQREESVALEEQGDGMRSFTSVILHLLAPVTPSVLFLDEPEAFLHPPQARLLGRMIATEKPQKAQLFVATHSTDVLQGLMDVATDHLRVVRMRREGDINPTEELDNELVQEISRDPLMKYSGVLSGLFHQRVIICEGDSDCMFYSSMLDIPLVHGSHHPDVLFVHAGGKNRMATMAQSLGALDVPVDVIADIDILRDQSDLKKLVEALKGDWNQVEPLGKSIKSAIEQTQPNLDSPGVKHEIEGILNEAPASGEFPNELRKGIEATFSKASRWERIKNAGQAALPPGDTTQRFQQIQQLCKQAGLWIVAEGQLEGFCRSVGDHGPRWAQKVIEQKNLATDHELEHAREFVKQIWDSKTSAP